MLSEVITQAFFHQHYGKLGHRLKIPDYPLVNPKIELNLGNDVAKKTTKPVPTSDTRHFPPPVTSTTRSS